MIVLDEQISGVNLQLALARWYRGKVAFLAQLRPGTTIKDDAIPSLLRRVRQPTLVTINVADFWRKLAPDSRFCVACLTLSDREADKVSPWLRRLFHLTPFQTKPSRMGKIARVSERGVAYYSVDSWAVERIDW